MLGIFFITSPPYLLLSFVIGFISFNIGIHNLLSKIGMSSIIRFLALFAIWTSYIYIFVQSPRFLSTATFTIIPATLSLLFVGMSVEDKRSSAVPDKLAHIVSKVGRATYPIYILQWTYIGALRLVFNVESIWLFNILFLIFSIPITFLFLRIDALFRSLFLLNAKNRKKSLTLSKLGFLTMIIFFITAMYPNEYTSTNFAPNSKLATKIESISITTSPEETQMIDLTLAVSNSSESDVTATFCMIFMENLGSTMTKFEIKGLIPPRAQGTITRTLEITKDVKLSSNPERWNARCF